MSPAIRYTISCILHLMGAVAIISISGCMKVVVVENGMSSDGRSLRLEFENVRFVPHDFAYQNIDSIETARSYWLKRGNRVLFDWQTFEMQWQSEGALCEFLNNDSSDDCLVCDHCRPQDLEDSCSAVVLPSGMISLVAEPTFVKTDSPTIVIDYSGPSVTSKIEFTCGRMAPSRPNDFQPAIDGLYSLRIGENLDANIIGETDGEVRMHVIASDAPQRVAFQLTPDSIDGNIFWRWDAGGAPVWEENFSPDIHISTIRFYNGRCIDDRSTGRTCVVPEGAPPVKPSRLLFIPEFPETLAGVSEADKRCYAIPGSNDAAYFDLSECRTTFSSDPNLATVPINVNPSYRIPEPGDLLTWLIDFNVNEGADEVQTSDQLIIEFTLEAN